MINFAANITFARPTSGT